MKKIINRPENVVAEMCAGIAAAHPELELIRKYKVIKRRSLNPEKVTLISGGGSGHEPAHAGFVGRGMLDAAVCGDVFASPSQIQGYQAIRQTAGRRGTLLIIKNYSGDMMNFKNAAHMAQEDGIEVDFVKVDDDIAVQDSLYTVGRRGVAGTMLVHKIAGAAAERGMSLPQVKALAEKTIANVRSIGFALSSCTVPAKGSPTFVLMDDEIEYGVGIHGEPGIEKQKILDADGLAARMVPALLESLGMSSEPRAEIAILINGFGATPLQELYLLNNSVVSELLRRGISIERILVGNYMTSLDMAGASVSFLKLDDELKSLLSDKADTPALHIDGPSRPVSLATEKSETPCCGQAEMELDKKDSVIRGEKLTLKNIVYLVGAMSKIVVENEVPFCELDSFAGDGDFGMSIAKGFRRLEAEWSELLRDSCGSVGQFLDACSMIIMEHCGGASGPIWGSAFRAAARAAGETMELEIGQFAELMQAAVRGIQKTGEYSFGRGAVVGDKTLIDALVPCADSWTESANKAETYQAAFAAAAAAAVRGAAETEKIMARMGRAGTVGKRSLGHPDAGAHALGVIFTQLAQAMTFEV